MKTLTVWLLTFTVIGSVASAATDSLTFGVYQSDKATVMHQTFSPIIRYLTETLHAKLGRAIDIQLKIFKTYDEGKDAIVSGNVDFVRFGPASYILCKTLNPNVQLLAMELRDGSKRFQGMIVVRQDSPIETLADLKGKRFAFGDPNSTIGRFLVQAEMIDAGVFARDLTGYDFLGRHDIVAKAVQLGDYEAGSIKDGTFKKYNRNNELRVLKAFDNVTKPWICREGMLPEIYTALKDALIALDDPDVLKVLKVSGFSEASDSDYQIIREAMAKSEGFDLGPEGKCCTKGRDQCGLVNSNTHTGTPNEISDSEHCD